MYNAQLMSYRIGEGPKQFHIRKSLNFLIFMLTVEQHGNN